MNTAQYFRKAYGYSPKPAQTEDFPRPYIIQPRKPTPLTAMHETRDQVDSLVEANKTTADKALPKGRPGAKWV